MLYFFFFIEPGAACECNQGSGCLCHRYGKHGVSLPLFQGVQPAKMAFDSLEYSLHKTNKLVEVSFKMWSVAYSLSLLN